MFKNRKGVNKALLDTFNKKDKSSYLVLLLVKVLVSINETLTKVKYKLYF